MKKKYFALFLLILNCVLMLVPTNSSIVCANEEITEEEIVEEAWSTINEINLDLQNYETSIEDELGNLYDFLMGDDFASGEYGNDFASLALEIESDYYDFVNEESDNGNSRILYPTTSLFIKAIKAGIVAIQVWFLVKGYYLSCELLSFSRINPSRRVTYNPIYGYKVESSRVFWDIVDGVDVACEFTNTGTTPQKDLYYSIHLFTYSKDYNNSYLYILDTYDYEFCLPNCVQNIAIDIVYLGFGLLLCVPYEVSIKRTVVYN